MIMEAKDIQSDLLALKRLYGLLKKDGDSMLNSSTDLLDEHARVLLKKLLDAATKRVLKDHSEIVAGTISATQLQQSDETSNKQSTPLPKLLISGKGMESDKDRKVDGLDISFWKEKRFFSPQPGPVQSALASGLEHKKKRCRLCQRNTVNHMEPVEETHFCVDARNSKRFTDTQHQQNNGSYHDLLNSHHEAGSLRDTAKVCKPENVDCLSKEASEAIEQIELFISALHIGENHLRMFEENSQTQGVGVSSVDKSQIEESFMSRSELAAEEMNQPYWLLNQIFSLAQPTKAMLTQSINNFLCRGPALGSDAPGELGESMEESKFAKGRLNNIYGQNVKAIIEKIEPVNWIMGHYDFVPQLNPCETSYGTPTWPPTFSTASKLEAPFRSHLSMEDECSTRRLFQTYKPSGYFVYPNNCEKIQSVDSDHKVGSILRARGKNHPPNMFRETLLNKKPSQLLDFHGNQSDALQKNEMRKNGRYITANDSLHSNSTSQQTSSRGSDSEDHSLTDQSGEYVTSSTWSESGASPLSYRAESQSNSYTGNIEDDVYSPTSSVADREMISSGSSKSKGYSLYDQPIQPHARSIYSSTSKKSGLSKARKFKEKNHNKEVGMWKRMKDKMTVIFHHHHHHHHDDRGKYKTKMSHNSSLFKHKGKYNNCSRQDMEAYGEKAVEKIKKSIIREKNQRSHFHGLMEGLLRHVRHSKQSKPRKKTIRKLGKGHHDRKKSWKKSHWWKLLKHHSRRKLRNMN